MGALTWLVLIGLLVVLIGGATFAVALARRSKQQLAAQIEPGPGMPDGAPIEWAGQHTPEAKLHRRLTALATTLAQLPLGDAAHIERKVAVETRVQELSRRLVALAHAPRDALREAVAKLEPEVAAAEDEVGKLATEPPL